MDVKAIQSTQSAIEMNTTNMQSQEKMEVTLKQSEDKKNENELFNSLPPNMQDDILKKTVKDLNEKLKLFNNSLKIEIDKDTGIRVVKIIDSKTKEVIRQLPPEAALKIAKYIDEITGLLFDKKA